MTSTGRSNFNPIAAQQYLAKAFAFFNAELFDGKLNGGVVLTLQRKRGALGHWRPQAFRQRGDNDAENNAAMFNEIAMGPDHFLGRDVIDILSTLVHEMCHEFQGRFGKPSTGNYHNRQFSKIMAECGLITSNTGKPGGKKTGRRISHYIEDGGAFDIAVKKFIAANPDAINWGAMTRIARPRRRRQRRKYTCPQCGLNAWAKPDVILLCGECGKELE